VYDLHYLTKGRWVVGRVVLNAERTRIARNIKQNMAVSPGLARQTSRYRLVVLCELGLGVVAFYQFQGEPTGELVNDIRLREFNHRQGRDAHFENTLDSSDLRPGLEDSYFEEMAYRERNVAPQLFRNAKSFDQGRIQ